MLQDILTIGDKIEVKRMDHSGKQIHGAKAYVSQLVDFADFDVIHIATPVIYGKFILLEVSENFNLCFYTSKGLYQCNCVILNNFRENNLIIAEVRLTSDLEKYQRRQYYRLECIHDILYRIISLEEEILENRLRQDEFKTDEARSECRKRLSQINNDWQKASFNDISGGGARFNSKLSHQPGDKIQIKFDFLLGNELKKLLLKAEVISSDKSMNRTDIFEHRVEFKNIGKNDREDLIKFIFEQDRKRRRNEKK